MIDLGMKEKLVRWLNSLTAKYVAVFVLLVAVPAIGISWYLLDSSYNDNKRALINQQRAQAQAIAGRIDQTLQDVLDRLGSVHGKGAKPEQVRTSLRPLILSALTPLMAFYMNGRGTDVASVGARALHVVRLGGGNDIAASDALTRRVRAGAERGLRQRRAPLLSTPPPTNLSRCSTWRRSRTTDSASSARLSRGAARSGACCRMRGSATATRMPSPRTAEHSITLRGCSRPAQMNSTDKSSQLPRTLSLPQVEDALHSSEPVGSATGENLKGTRVLSAGQSCQPPAGRCS